LKSSSKDKVKSGKDKDKKTLAEIGQLSEIKKRSRLQLESMDARKSSKVL
jgi:hypothetical protein